MVSDIRLNMWRDEFSAMSDDELRIFAASGRAKAIRLNILQLEIQRRERLAGDEDKGEELDIAREANRLAAEANEKANTANTIATSATIIAIIAMAISIISAIIQAH